MDTKEISSIRLTINIDKDNLLPREKEEEDYEDTYWEEEVDEGSKRGSGG